MNTRLTIAIDGYSACGKSTLAKDLAQKLDYIFIDSGAMYRGVTLYALRNKIADNDKVDEETLISQLDQISITFQKNNDSGRNHLFLNGEDVESEIRLPEVASYVSKVATIKEVREKLVSEQRKMGFEGGIVMDGRDIGSVVFPNAELKLFVTADPSIRAQRRLKELSEKGLNESLESVLENLQERDYIDENRSESPLTRTPDAILVDTTNHTRESQLAFVIELINTRFN